jgi:hypothetical protein
MRPRVTICSAFNVHYPTDSTLLQDSVRVLTRTMQRASAALGDANGRVRNRLRSVMRRVLIIGYQARSPKTRAGLVESYRKLMATTRAVVRDADTMVRRIGHRVRTVTPAARCSLRRASPARRAHEQQRWFRRGQRWRVGSEGRISVLKRRHGLDRCLYHGLDGMKRWVGLASSQITW